MTSSRLGSRVRKKTVALYFRSPTTALVTLPHTAGKTKTIKMVEMETQTEANSQEDKISHPIRILRR